MTRRDIAEVFASEVAAPLEADAFIRLGGHADHRTVDLIPTDLRLVDGLEPTSIAYRTQSNPVLPATLAGSTAWRHACIPAAGGYATAQGIA